MKYFLLICMIIVSGCSVTSSGLSLGMKGSPAWFKNASSQDASAYLKDLSLDSLKNMFIAGRSKKSRPAVITELRLRGLPALETLFGVNSVVYLRELWNNAYQDSQMRDYIALELTRRGLDGSLFYDPSTDLERRRLATLERIESNKSNSWKYENPFKQVSPTYEVKAPSNVTYTRVGNIVYGSDGSSCTKIGNQIHCN